MNNLCFKSTLLWQEGASCRLFFSGLVVDLNINLYHIIVMDMTTMAVLHVYNISFSAAGGIERCEPDTLV